MRGDRVAVVEHWMSVISIFLVARALTDRNSDVGLVSLFNCALALLVINSIKMLYSGQNLRARLANGGKNVIEDQLQR